MVVIEYRVKIGLEVHIPISTLETKLFCRCRNPYKYPSEKPNQYVCPVCLGLPGALPKPNRDAIEKAVKLAALLHMDIPDKIQFYRKHYLYPDLPKGYQITQYVAGAHKPVGLKGIFQMNNGREVRIKRIQLEEDPARLVHPGGLGESKYVLIDYNRSGSPLIELVTEPDFTDPSEAKQFLLELIELLMDIGILEEGGLVVRTDANVSLEGGARVEIKNLGSASDVEKAINFEIIRMKRYLEEGVEVKRETRHWDERRKVTVPLREKEFEEEYRYIPDPNIPPINIKKLKDKAMLEIPRLRIDIINDLVSKGVPENIASVLVRDREYLQIFEKLVEELNLAENEHVSYLASLLVNEGRSIVNRGFIDMPKLTQVLKLILSMYREGLISKEEGRRKLKGLEGREGEYADEETVKHVVEKVLSTIDKVGRRTRDYVIGRVIEELGREGYVVDVKTILKYVDVRLPKRERKKRKGEIKRIRPRYDEKVIENRINIRDAFLIREGRHTVTGWLESKMYVGDRLFVILRDWTGKIQVITDTTKNVYNLLDSLPKESFIAVTGYLKEDRRAPGGVEVEAIEVIPLSETYNPPLSLLDLSRSSYTVRMRYRYLDIRRRRIRAILSFREKMIDILREYLKENGFVEINTPTIIASASEGGAELFPILYYGREAFLAQSPQLYKQMALNAFEKVFEIDSYYRAQKFDTNRHLTEFWSLDVEAALYNLDKLLKLQEDMLGYAIKRLTIEAREELDILEVKLEPVNMIPRITYSEALEIAQEKGVDIEYGEDLNLEAMKAVAEEYDWKPHHIILWPKSTRAFYYRIYDEDPNLTLSFDLVYPVKDIPLEVSSGGERINDAETLIKRLRESGLREEGYEWYLNMFRYGMPPHGGFGLGIDRLLMAMLSLDHIFDSVLLPRTPKYYIP